MLLNTLTKTVANPINEVATNASNLWNSIVALLKKYGPSVIYAIVIFLVFGFRRSLQIFWRKD